MSGALDNGWYLLDNIGLPAEEKDRVLARRLLLRENALDIMEMLGL